VITIPTAPWLHYLGDVAAWVAALLGGRWVYRYRANSVDQFAKQTAPSYFVCLAAGAAVGAWVLGSLNTLRDHHPALSHSIAGALAGAILAVEIWKVAKGIRTSTGGVFVIPLCLGIVVGRWGCLFAGLADQTYGVPTRLPWGVDLGDGVSRHPVQIYESLSMLVFLLLYLEGLARRRDWAMKYGFYWMAIAYGGERFIWEFLKPYPTIIGPFNVFHLISGGLVIYGCIWIARARRQSA